MNIQQILDNRQCFKLVCGAGNENVEQVRRLVFVYALAGANIFDLSANEDVVMAAQDSLKRAKSEAALCVSVGIAGDPHVSKAVIDADKCIKCGACHSVCPQNAIDDKTVNHQKCIGCHKCEAVCHNCAISFVSQTKPVTDILSPLCKYPISVYELHAIGENEAAVDNDWAAVCEMPSLMKSLCIDRSKVGNERLIARIRRCLDGRQPQTTIIQTDGTPMSGGKDDFRTTLQAIATAELVTKYNIPAYILLSGGTNSNSSYLAHILGVPIHGVAIGSFARQIVADFIADPHFWERPDLIGMAVTRAKILVKNITG